MFAAFLRVEIKPIGNRYAKPEVHITPLSLADVNALMVCGIKQDVARAIDSLSAHSLVFTDITFTMDGESVKVMVTRNGTDNTED
jgi:hypothetical protein